MKSNKSNLKLFKDIVSDAMLQYRLAIKQQQTIKSTLDELPEDLNYYTGALMELKELEYNILN